MLSYKSGIIGLPLRLLAREVYDKIVRLRGISQVALLTGEERIVPIKACYWVCTVEAMPEGISAEFLAVDGEDTVPAFGPSLPAANKIVRPSTPL